LERKKYISGGRVIVVIQDKENGERGVFRIKLNEVVEALNNNNRKAVRGEHWTEVIFFFSVKINCSYHTFCKQ